MGYVYKNDKFLVVSTIERAIKTLTEKLTTISNVEIDFKKENLQV
ncbi:MULTISPECIES: hypothetical protein [unclassified Gemella]|nr:MULTISPECIES: hypothetical protein [unclassified Gemella]